MISCDDNGRAIPEPYIAVYRFMSDDMGLSGLQLLIYARIYGFWAAGLDYYESKSSLSAFLGANQRSVFRAMADLCKQDLIEDVGEFRGPNGSSTRRYSIVASAIPARIKHHGKMPHPCHSDTHEADCHDDSCFDDESANGVESETPMAKSHLIRKEENKDFK